MVYNEKVMEIFQNPKNVGKLKGANAVGQVGNVACGDIMKIYLKINDNQVIEDASFETFGCAAAIVSSSIATEIIKGWTVEQALNFDNNMIIKEVGELPVHKIHCSVLAKEAIEDAITKYQKKQAKQAKAEVKATKTEKTSSTKKTTKVEKVVEEVLVEDVTPKKEVKKQTKKEVIKEVKHTPIPSKNLIAEKEEKTKKESIDFKSALSALKTAKKEKEVVAKTAVEEKVVEESKVSPKNV